MRTLRVASALLFTASLLSGASVVEARAQEASAGAVAGLAAQRADAERAHLRRVAWWGGASLALGAGLYAGAGPRDGLRAFGMQTALWGGVDLVIGVLTQPRPVAASWSQAVADERFLTDVLLFNTGLNVAYIATGGMLVLASYYGVRHAVRWRGHGAAIIAQGTALLVLDAAALVAARGRLGTLLGIPGDLAALPLPNGVGLAWAF